MKKLYFLNEEEKNRILNLHESATKRQYLMETPLTDFYDKLPAETKKKFTAMNNTWQDGGTREGDMLNVLKTFTADDYNKYNQYLLLHKNSSDPLEYSSFQEIINGEMGKDNLQDVINITNQLKNMGVNATYVKDNIADLHPNSFKIGGPDTKGVASDANWNSIYACVTKAKGATPTTLSDKSTAYILNGYVYYNNGFKRKQPVKTNKSEKYTCNSPEFKTGVSTEDKAKKLQQYKQQIITNTSNTTKQIQKFLGLPETGIMDSGLLQKINEKLNGKPQEAPKADVTTQPKAEPLQQLTTAGVKTQQLTTPSTEQLTAGLQQQQQKAAEAAKTPPTNKEKRQERRDLRASNRAELQALKDKQRGNQ